MAKKPTAKQPGDMFNALQAKRAKKVKTTGSFHGKSNALGHGGRAAQLKAQGVPGGVIGALARRAGATPGGPNYHGKKAKKRKGAPVAPLANVANNIPRNVMEKKAKKRKMTMAEDRAYDRKHGIKEGSKRDIAEDKKHGVKDKKRKLSTPQAMAMKRRKHK